MKTFALFLPSSGIISSRRFGFISADLPVQHVVESGAIMVVVVSAPIKQTYA